MTWTHTLVTAATLLIVDVGTGLAAGDDTTEIETVTANGIRMKSQGKAHSANGVLGNIESFTLLNPPTGTVTIVVTRTGGTGTITLNGASTSYTGVGGIGTPVLNQGTSSSPATTTAITSATVDMVHAAMAAGNSFVTIGGGTQRVQENTNASSGGGNFEVADAAGAATVTITCTLTVDDWCTIGYDLQAAVNDHETIWSGTASVGQTFTPGVGNLLVALGGDQQASAISFSSTVLTWANDVNLSGAAQAATRADHTYGTGVSITTTETAAAGKLGQNVLEFSAQGLSIGATTAVQGLSGTHITKTITTTAAHSMLAVFVNDGSAQATTSHTWDAINGIAPSAANGYELTAVQTGTSYTVYAAYYPDTGAAGLQTVGITLGTSATAVTVEIIEIITPTGVYAPWLEVPPGNDSPAAIFGPQAYRDDTPPSGAQSLTDTETDNAGLTDSIIVDQSPVLTDSTGLTDNVATQVAADGYMHWTEVPPGFDSPASQPNPFIDTTQPPAAPILTDNAGLTDNMVVDQTQTFTDSAGVTDNIVTDQFLVRTDTENLTDDQAITQSLVVTDTTGLTDNLVVDLFTVATDSAGLTDSVTTQSITGDYAHWTEYPPGFDSPTALLEIFNPQVGDSIVGAQSLTDTRTDDTGLTDNIVTDQSPVTTDTAGLTDNTVVDQTKVQTDSAGLTDNTVTDQTKVVTDDTGLTDSIFTQIIAGEYANWTEVPPGFDSPASLIEIFNPVIGDQSLVLGPQSFTDNENLTDNTVVDQTQTVTDVTGLTDNQAITQGKVVTDLSGLTDSVVVALFKVIVDNAGLTDSIIVDQSGVVTNWPHPGANPQGTNPSAYENAGAGAIIGGNAAGTAAGGGTGATVGGANPGGYET